MIKNNNNSIVIDKNKTLKDALIRLNELKSYSKLVLFVSENNKIIGSLTDGDIRRALTNDININCSIYEVCNKNFYKVFANKSDYINLKPYRNKAIGLLPVLNENSKLKYVIDLEKTKAILPLECVIMAGGRGKRLSPLTDKTPKPMLLLGGKPIIEHNIDMLISYGIKKFHISVNYKKEKIIDYFKDGKHKGIEINYLIEDEFLGTAGALSLVSNLSTNNLFVMNGDLLTNLDIEMLYNKHLSKKSKITISTVDYKIDIPFAIFKYHDDLVKSFEEKPTFSFDANAGCYIITSESLKIIPKNNYFDMTDFMQKVLDSGEVVSTEKILGYWIDIGNPNDFKRAQEFIDHKNK